MDYTSPEGLAKLLEEALDRIEEDPAWLSVDKKMRDQIMSLKDPEKLAKITQRYAKSKKQNRFLTSFYLNWDNCSLSEADAPAHERLKIYTYHNRIVWQQYDGLEHMIQEQSFRMSKSDKIRVFAFFDEVFGEYEGFEKRNRIDFSIPACDGSEWQIRVKYSHSAEKRIHGNVEMPPYGPEIVALLKEIFSHYNCKIDPAFFGI